MIGIRQLASLLLGLLGMCAALMGLYVVVTSGNYLADFFRWTVVCGLLMLLSRLVRPDGWFES